MKNKITALAILLAFGTLAHVRTVATIILDDYRKSKMYCQSFKQPAIFLLFAFLSFIWLPIFAASTIFLPLVAVPIFIAYSYAKFRTKFWTAVSNNFH